MTRAQPPALPRNSNGRLGFPGPTQEDRERAALNILANLENSAVATGLEMVSYSFQSQRKAMTKNAQPPTQLHSYHMLVR